MDLSKRMLLFAQFSAVSLEVKTENEVEDQILAMYGRSIMYMKRY